MKGQDMSEPPESAQIIRAWLAEQGATAKAFLEQPEEREAAIQSAREMLQEAFDHARTQFPDANEELTTLTERDDAVLAAGVRIGMLRTLYTLKVLADKGLGFEGDISEW